MLVCMELSSHLLYTTSGSDYPYISKLLSGILAANEKVHQTKLLKDKDIKRLYLLGHEVYSSTNKKL